MGVCCIWESTGWVITILLWNKANLRDLIATTGPVILLKLDSNCLFFSPCYLHNDVIKWKHFPRYWPFVRGIHRPPVNSPHKGQWRGALMFTLIWARINSWVNNCEAGDLRRYRPHYGVIVMLKFDGWPRKIIGHIFYTTSSFVHHFKSISELKLVLQSGNTQFELKSIFLAAWPWNLTDALEKQQGSSSWLLQALCIIL